MKKILYITLSLLLLLTSCDLDKKQSGTIGTADGLQSMEDVANMRNNLYVRLRGMYDGFDIYLGELQTDIFHPSIGFGNRGGTEYRWEQQASWDDAESKWSSSYSITAVANYLLGQIEKLETTLELTDAEKTTLELYKGECYFMKAITLFELMQRFAPAYDAATASSDLGVIIEKTYEPTSDITKYKPRSTVAEVYAYIDECLDIAKAGIASEEGVVASEYLTIDAVNAMAARIALTKGDYDAAIQYSTGLINSGTYPLIEAKDTTKHTALWANDSGEECIMQLYADYPAESVPVSLSYGYISKAADGKYSPDYILEKWILDLYSINDIRAYIWFTEQTLTYGTIVGDAVLLNKFPGNRTLQSPDVATSSHIHKIKPYRIAEQYLIAAEAYAMKGDVTNGAKYLNELRESRIADYISAEYSLDGLIDEVANERVRELIGEGFRFFDLKRRGEGFARSEVQNPDVTDNATNPNISLRVVSADDPRFLWPIPQAEIDANPQIKGQQNPGY